MTYNKFEPTKTETPVWWLLRLAWPYIWGLVALAAGIVTKSGWGILVGVAVLAVWLYVRTRPIRNRRNDKQRYQGSDVDLKWQRKAVANASSHFDAAGLSIPNSRDPDGRPSTPKVLSYDPCPRGSRWSVELIHGRQHGEDFLGRLLNLESAFGQRMVVELDTDPRRVTLIFLFTDPLSETRRPDDSPVSW